MLTAILLSAIVALFCLVLWAYHDGKLKTLEANVNAELDKLWHYGLSLGDIDDAGDAPSANPVHNVAGQSAPSQADLAPALQPGPAAAGVQDPLGR